MASTEKVWVLDIRFLKVSIFDHVYNALKVKVLNFVSKFVRKVDSVVTCASPEFKTKGSQRGTISKQLNNQKY